MDPKLIDLQKQWEARIDALKGHEDKKEMLKRTVNGIIAAPRGRLVLEQEPNFEKYLTLRRANFEPTSQFELCIVSAMKEDANTRDYNFLSLTELISVIEQNKDVIESELVNVANYQKNFQQANSTPDKPLTPKEMCKKMMEEALGNMQNVPDYKKQRAIDVVNEVFNAQNGRLVSKPYQNGFEAITMKQANGTYGYYKMTKQFDPSTGIYMPTQYTPLAAKSLLQYVDENRVSIDKEMQKQKAQTKSTGEK